MNDSHEDNLFPWEDEPASATAQPDATDAVDPFDANEAPPIPAEVAPDEAADHVHQDDFVNPTVQAVEEPRVGAPREAAPPEPAARRTETHTRQLVKKEYYSISEV